MKLLFENWRRFLIEAKQGPHQIYCDMDGVLVDFVAGVVKQINEDVGNARLENQENGKFSLLGKLRRAMKEEGVERIEDTHILKFTNETSKTRSIAIKYMYAAFRDDVDFWANLPWMPGGRQLWDAIKKYNPNILTAPMGKGSEEGKRQWINKNLKPAPKEIFMSHDKFNWATTGDNKNVLIDDFKTNIKPWGEHGGIAIHHSAEDLANTFKQLAELGFSVTPAPNEHTDEDPEDPFEDMEIEDES